MEGLKLIYPLILDYYKQSEIDSKLTTLSGNLVIYIDQKDLEQYNYLVTTSGDITDWVLSQNYATYLQLTTTSGDILSRVSLDYTTIQKLTTTSGDIIAQFPSLSGYATQTWVNVNFIDTTEMTTISGDIVAQIPSVTGYATESWVNLNFVDNAEIITISGNIVAQIPSLSGYATQVWVNTNFIDNSEMTTISGDIISQIPSLSGYATETWVVLQDYSTGNQLTTTSGDIVSQFPSLAGYATESWTEDGFVSNIEMTTISGDIIAQIPSLGGYTTESWVNINFPDNEELTTVSGDIVSQIGVGGVTQEQLTTTSGDIVSQIPSLSGYATESWVNINFPDNSEITTISGDLVAQISAGGVTQEQLTTTSGDIVAQIGESTGASESWVNENFVDNIEMTTISGDLVAQMGGSLTLEGTGGIITEKVGDIWYVDGSGITTSGGTTGSGIECATCASGVLVVQSGVETPYVRFSDGTVATTTRNIITCSGEITTEVFTVNYNNTFPKLAFTLPINHEITSIDFVVGSGFSGGAGANDYPGQIVTGTFAAGNYTFVRMGRTLPKGSYIKKVGVYTTGSVAGMQLKLAKFYTNNFFGFSTLTVSGGSTTFTTSGGYYWQTIDITQVPLTDDYYIACYYPTGATANTSNLTSYGLGRSYKTGNATGDSSGFAYDTTYFPCLTPVFCSALSLGENANQESLLQKFCPTTTTGITISGVDIGTDWAPTAYDRYIQVYNTNTTADTQGEITFTVKHREHCFDNYRTTITGGGDLYIESTGLNSYSVSSVSPCRQSSCLYQTNTTVASGVSTTYPRRLFLLPANNVIDRVEIYQPTQVLGGSNGSAGHSIGTPSNRSGSTCITTEFNLINQAVITRVWLYATAAASVKIKIGKYISDTSYEISTVATVSHPGTGEVEFALNPPVTVTGVGTDVMRVGFYSATSNGILSTTDFTGNYTYKVGDLTGVVTSMSTLSSVLLVRVGYMPWFSIGTSANNTKYVPTFSAVSGTNTYLFNDVVTVQEVTPINMYYYADAGSYPASGVVTTKFYYHDPSYTQYTRGFGLTWSGTSGTSLTHNLGTTSHLLYITPLTTNPGNWWVTKGTNADIVYSDTLSGTGSFDWFIQS
jgi:DUF4097 and DUF4098 domain-containing protein YvlB